MLRDGVRFLCSLSCVELEAKEVLCCVVEVEVLQSRLCLLGMRPVFYAHCLVLI